MAFLHRVVNGSGRITREYATGRGRMDLLVEHGRVRLAIELKLWRDKAQDPLEAGLRQLDEYLARTKADEGWLMIFDRRRNAPPLPDRLSAQAVRVSSGCELIVVPA